MTETVTMSLAEVRATAEQLLLAQGFNANPRPLPER
jgi:hypothetical protein